jgi:hypothetical protein
MQQMNDHSPGPVVFGSQASFAGMDALDELSAADLSTGRASIPEGNFGFINICGVRGVATVFQITGSDAVLSRSSGPGYLKDPKVWKSK